MLPDRLGDFVIELGANPGAEGAVYPYTNTIELGEDFGLGALYNAEDETLTITIGERQIPLTQMQGVLGLYKCLDTKTDLLLRQFDFDYTMTRQDRSVLITINGITSPKHLHVLAEIELGSGLILNAITAVTTLSSRKPMLEPVRSAVTRRRQTGDDPVDNIVKSVVVIDEAQLYDVLHLDFSLADSIVVGAGALTYAGGGNRYLVSSTGPAWQEHNQAPWLMQAVPVLEPAGGNEFHAYNLNNRCYSFTGDAVVTDYKFNIDGFEESFVGMHLQHQPLLNGTWLLAFDAIPWDGNTVTASMFTRANTGTHNVRLGLRLNGVDYFSDTKLADKLDVVGFSWVKPDGAVAVAGTAQILVQVRDLNPGDFVEVEFGFPQLESGSSVSSRSTGTRAADTVVFTPTYALEREYGRFDIVVSPNYAGIPNNYGAQIFFDTRNSIGLDGFWCGHTRAGLLEFGMSDDIGNVYVRSASAVQLDPSKPHTLSCYFDASNRNMRIDCDGVVVADKTVPTITVPLQLNQIRFGARFNEDHLGNFVLHSFKHQQTPN